MPTPAPFFVDHALSARLEALEAAHLEDLVPVVAERVPESSPALLSVAGGIASFLAPHFSLSRAAGLGMKGPVEHTELEAFEDFYRSRHTEARILVSPYAHPSLFEQLGARGFQLVYLDTLLLRHLDAADASPRPAEGAIHIRRAELDEAAAWVDASLQGFMGSNHAASPAHSAMYRAAFHVPDVTYFFAYQGAEVAGTGALYLHDKSAYFFATSTLAEHRGRGCQGALIDARIDLARERGAEIAFTVTEPGTNSQRNFERRGFRPVYSRALLLKRFEGRGV